MHRIRRRRRRVNGKLAASAVAAGLLLAASHRSRPARAWPAAASTAPSPAAATAIAYARAQLGKPYVCGGHRPGRVRLLGAGSGGVGRPPGCPSRAPAKQQWADLPHVSSPQPGDLVFFTGVDRSTRRPATSRMYIGGGQMIEAYATGYPDPAHRGCGPACGVTPARAVPRDARPGGGNGRVADRGGCLVGCGRGDDGPGPAAAPVACIIRSPPTWRWPPRRPGTPRNCSPWSR